MKSVLKKGLSVLLAFTMVFSSAYVGLNEIDFGEISFNGINLSGVSQFIKELTPDFSVKSQAASSDTCGDNLTWSLDDEGTLTISGTGDMYDYSSSSRAPWYSARSSITAVTISDSVTSIGNYAFYSCTNLTSILILDSVTSIGDYAFSSCRSLTSIEIPDSVTSIGEYAFYNCTSLTIIEIPDSVTSIGGSAFRNCTSLTTIEIPDSVTSIGYQAFYNCTSLITVTIGDSVTSIGYQAFYNCTSLTTVTIGDSVTNIGEGAFSDCTSLTTIEIPDSVTSIGDFAFSNCTSLTSIEIPDSVTSIVEGAFSNCTSLTSVYITDIAAWCNINFYDYASNPLCYAKNLYINGELATEVVIPDSVTSIGGSAFFGCTSLTTIEIPDSVTSIGDDAFYNCTSLITVKIGDSVTSIGGSAFSNCTSLTSIEIPDSVTSIGGYAFSGCTSLTSIEIPDSVTSIGGSAFEGCRSLTTIEIPDSVTSIGDEAFYNTGYYNNSENWEDDVLYIDNYLIRAKTSKQGNYIMKEGTKSIAGEAFRNCTSLTTIEIPDSVTSIGGSAFEGCTSLTTIEIPDSVTSIGGSAFEGCTRLSSIEIPDSVTSIGYEAFRNCTNLTSVSIGDSVTSIGSSAFEGCTSLTTIEIPDSVTSIGGSAFRNCTNLTSVSIGDSVTSIGRWAFYNCTSLTSIEISDSVTSIGSWTFYSCTNLTSILIPDSVTSIDYDAFERCSKLTIYGVLGSYAERYADECDIPFKSVDAFGYVNFHSLSEGITTFRLFDKQAFIDYDGIDIGLEDVYSPINNAIAEYSGEQKELSSNRLAVATSNFPYDITFTAEGFRKYIIPEIVTESYEENSVVSVDVHMAKDLKDGKPYISTVFGVINDEDYENEYEELQTNSLDILKDVKYNIVVSADLKGETSATYYIYQDATHKISNKTGVFSNVDLYKEFYENVPIYVYAVTDSGKATEPVAVQMKKTVCSDGLTKLLSSSKINILGSDFGKITIDKDIPVIGGAELSMSFLEFPIGIEFESGRVRISIGRDFFKASKETTTTGKRKPKTEVEKEWISYKEFCKELEKEMTTASGTQDKFDAYEKAKKERGFGSDKIKKTKKSNLSFDASYMGYIEGYLTPDGNVLFTEFSGSIAAEFIAQYTVNGSVGVVPTYLYVQGGAGAALSLTLADPVPDPDIPLKFDVSLGVTPKLKIGGGVGTKGVASAGIYGSANLPTVYEFLAKHLSMVLSGSIGVEGEFIVWGGNKDLVSGSWQIFDTYFGSSKAALSDFSESVYSDMAELTASDNSEVEYSLVSRDYAESTSGWLGSAGAAASGNGSYSGSEEQVYGAGAASVATVNDLQTSVYKNSQTQLVNFGDKMMLAYIEDCAERDTYNRYRLMYVTYDPSTDGWSEPKAVYDSGKMDVSPCLATDGENVYIAWQTVNTTITDSTQESMFKAIDNMEIYSAKYDVTTDSFVNVTQHTSNETYDYSPYVTVVNDSATVYWVNAKSTDYAAGEMSIHSSANPGNTLVYDNMNYIVSLKASGDEISYSMDVDGDVNTVYDIKLFTNGVQVGEGVVEDTDIITNFAYDEFNGYETLFYSDGGTVFYVKDGETVEAFTDNGGVADSLLVTDLNGKPAVIYNQLTQMGSELRVSVLENDEWSEPVYLTDSGALLSNVDVVSIDGKVYAVFNKTKTSEVTDDVTGDTRLEYGQTDLCMLTSEGYYDLEISNLGYDEGNVSIGTPAPFVVVLENKGTEVINNVAFTVSDELGYSQTVTKDVNLIPGAIESVELEYVAQENYNKSDLTVTASISDCADVDLANNTTTAQIGRTDITVGAVTVERIGDIFKINCEVVNDSLIEAENVQACISYGINKKQVNIGTMAAKSLYMVELFVAKDELNFDENGLCTITFSATTDSEELAWGNNENSISVGNTEKLEEHKHNIVNNVCDGCGLSEFLYEVSDDGLIITGANITEAQLVVPDSIGEASVVAIAASAFEDCTNITSVTIPDSVTSIGENAFNNTGYYNDESNWENDVLYIGNCLIAAKESLTGSCEIKSGTKVIADNAFNGCTSLTSVTIPDSVITIGASAFNECNNISDVYYEGTQDEWGAIAIAASSTFLPDARVHYNVDLENWEDHYGEPISETLPTCTNNGSRTYTCPCGYEKTEAIETTGEHTYGAEWIIDVAPTCTEDGLKSHHCTGCDSKADITVIMATGHTESGWITDKKATVTASGEKHKECTVCGETLETATIKQLKCSAPKISKAENTSSGVKITWGKVSGADKYKVYRSTKKSSGYEYIGATSKTYFTDEKVKSGTTYYYKVKAVNEAGDSSSSSAKSIERLVAAKISKVENTSSGVKVTWGKVSGADKYTVYRSTKKSSGFKAIATTSKTYYTDKAAKSGTTYYYKVVAVNDAGDTSASSSAKSVKYLADTTLKSATSGKSGVTLKWSKVSGASGYYVYRATGSGSYSKLATVKGSTKVSYVDKTAKKGKTYKYKLKAYSGSTTSAYSNAKSVKDKY